MPIAAATIAKAVNATQTLPILLPPSGASGILRSPRPRVHLCLVPVGWFGVAILIGFR